MRSTIWVPEKDKTKHTARSTHSFRLGFEGGLHPAIATAIMALQTHYERIVEKRGISSDGRLARPSEGGFSVTTEKGRTVSMWQAQAYGKEEPTPKA